MLRSLPLALLSVSVVILLGGCLFSRARTNVSDFYTRVESVAPGQTRARVLVYSREVERGLGFVARVYSAPVLTMSHSHSASDSTIILVDRNGVVTSVDRSDGTELAGYRVWPFGS